jgi:uncharacterized protein YbcI
MSAAGSSSPRTGRPRGGELNAAVAKGVVKCHATLTGRGPSRARSFFEANVVVVIVESALNPGERSLAAAGMADTVIQVRRELQQAMRDRLVSLVEELTGCRVEAFMAEGHIGPDLIGMVFVLDRPVPH